MLTPRPSSSREYLRLDGLWRFRFDPSAEGVAARWWSGPLPGGREMPVPASYNDLVTDPAERDYVGDVWYQRDVWVPGSWAGRRIVLRCDAATHHGTMWAGTSPANTGQVAEHTGGHTAFGAELHRAGKAGGAAPGHAAGRQRADPGHDPARRDLGPPRRAPDPALLPRPLQLRRAAPVGLALQHPAQLHRRGGGPHRLRPAVWPGPGVLPGRGHR